MRYRGNNYASPFQSDRSAVLDDLDYVGPKAGMEFAEPDLRMQQIGLSRPEDFDGTVGLVHHSLSETIPSSAEFVGQGVHRPDSAQRVSCTHRTESIDWWSSWRRPLRSSTARSLSSASTEKISVSPGRPAG